MYVGLFMAAVLGVCLTALLDWLERALIPWKRI